MATLRSNRIVITGDSFVEGVGASTGGWAQRLARDLAPRPVTVHGIGGDTSDDLITRIDSELDPAPEFVFVGIGINDARWRALAGRHEVSIEDYLANVERLIDTVVALGSQLWFVGLTSVDEALTDPFKDDKHYRNRSIATYDVRLRGIARRRQVGYIAGPNLAAIDGGLADGLHPSDVGHNLLLRAVRAAAVL